MVKDQTQYSLLEAYGGLSAVFISKYFWWAIALAVATTFSIGRFDWAGLGIGILPALIGFSIAAFAVMFALLDKNARDRLAIEKEAGAPPPLLKLFATIGWVLIAQTVSLVYLIFIKVKPFPHRWSEEALSVINGLLTLTGNILLFYSLLLVISVVLYLFDTIALFTSGINEAVKELQEKQSKGG
ncbi:MAG: hypothetical protein AAGA34_05585 [Pseudomonadota bacterium]